jgi:hypothetical protein
MLHVARLPRRRSYLRSVAFMLGMLLASVGVGYAAWTIFSGVSGTGSGKIGNPTVIGALSFVAIPNTVPVIPGSPGSFDATAHNDTGVTQTITTISGTVTASIAGCASHLSIDPAQFVGLSLSATPVGGFDLHRANAIVADNTLPANCAGADITVTLTGTTTAG